MLLSAWFPLKCLTNGNWFFYLFIFWICWKDAHVRCLSVHFCRVAAAFAILSFGKLGRRRLWSAPHSWKVASLIPARTFLPGVCMWLPGVCVGFLSHSDSSEVATWELSDCTCAAGCLSLCVDPRCASCLGPQTAGMSSSTSGILSVASAQNRITCAFIIISPLFPHQRLPSGKGQLLR